MNQLSRVPQNHDFSIHNLPFGVYEDEGKPCIGVAYGDYILNMSRIARAGLLQVAGLPSDCFDGPVLNPFMQCGRPVHKAVRLKLQELLQNPDSPLFSDEQFTTDRLEARMLMPVTIGDYTDFYSSMEHATNVGKMFRPDNPLLPNWKHLPVAYHGRSSSIVLSGTGIHRPKGQQLTDSNPSPVLGPSRQLDFELEMAFITCSGQPMGKSVSCDEAEDYIFGMVLFNDWSARDIQRWEYVPLGPFLGKNFASTMSPWVVTMDALEPFRTQGPVQDPEPLPYLRCHKPGSFDIRLEVTLQPQGGSPTIISRSNYKYLYWNMSQQLAHHTINGCKVRSGDLMASGTISGPQKGSFGSLLEISWGGTEPVTLISGEQRTFIEDHDTLCLRGWCEKDGIRVGFGECCGEVLPAW